ncbi:MAG TPA: class I SAM-dependent methyltransferase [Acidimicrobiales bacterium]|nr:class I SAM-dependent methyltransferase [Acidimicrobiales bacterium]
MQTDGGSVDWNERYLARGADAVSWFQAAPSMSLELVELLDVPTDAPVVDVGGGASTLVDELLHRRYEHVSVVDLSDAALQLARDRVGSDDRAAWMVADILDWQSDRPYGLWHDRAVFHFLVRRGDQRRYVESMRANLRPGAGVIIGTFAADGPTECSGFPVARYDVDALIGALGDGLRVVASRREEHVTPWGTIQPFTWLAGTYL